MEAERLQLPVHEGDLDAERIHALRVLTPEGKEFVLKNTKDTEPTNVGSTAQSDVGSTISSVSKNRIPQSKRGVKENSGIDIMEAERLQLPVHEGDLDADRIHALRVLTPEGKEFVLKNTKDTELTSAGSTAQSDVGSAIGSVSKNRIPQSEREVKFQ